MIILVEMWSNEIKPEGLNGRFDRLNLSLYSNYDSLLLIFVIIFSTI